MASLIGKLTGIYIGNPESEVKTSVEAAELISGHGLCGDSHAGRDPNRQVSLFATEVLIDLQADGFKVPPERLSANLFTENIQLNSLEPGTRLRIGETEVEIAIARKPCRSITRIDNRLPKHLYGRCGQLARIVKGGAVRTGDEIEIL
jgi:MOSC domain-containing protein YiiM